MKIAKLHKLFVAAVQRIDTTLGPVAARTNELERHFAKLDGKLEGQRRDEDRRRIDVEALEHRANLQEQKRVELEQRVERLEYNHRNAIDGVRAFGVETRERHTLLEQRVEQLEAPAPGCRVVDRIAGTVDGWPVFPPSMTAKASPADAAVLELAEAINKGRTGRIELVEHRNGASCLYVPRVVLDDESEAPR